MRLRPFAVVVVLAVLVLAGLAAYEFMTVPGNVTTPVPTSFTVNGRSFVFNYTAVTQAERESGLMNKKVTDSTTMLFVFPSPVIQSFWMYQTNTSLDMIWVNAAGNSGTVVYVAQNAQPCPSLPCPDYPSDGQPPLANYVIEAKAGFATANGIAVGTAVRFA